MKKTLASKRPPFAKKAPSNVTLNSSPAQKSACSPTPIISTPSRSCTNTAVTLNFVPFNSRKLSSSHRSSTRYDAEPKNNRNSAQSFLIPSEELKHKISESLNQYILWPTSYELGETISGMLNSEEAEILVEWAQLQNANDGYLFLVSLISLGEFTLQKAINNLIATKESTHHLDSKRRLALDLIRKALSAYQLDFYQKELGNTSKIRSESLIQWRKNLYTTYTHYLKNTDRGLENKLISITRTINLELARRELSNHENKFEIVFRITCRSNLLRKTPYASDEVNFWDDYTVFPLANTLIEVSDDKDILDLESATVNTLIKSILELNTEEQQAIIDHAPLNTLIDLYLFLSQSNTAPYTLVNSELIDDKCKLTTQLFKELRVRFERPEDCLSAHKASTPSQFYTHLTQKTPLAVATPSRKFLSTQNHSKEEKASHTRSIIAPALLSKEHEEKISQSVDEILAIHNCFRSISHILSSDKANDLASWIQTQDEENRYLVLVPFLQRKGQERRMLIDKFIITRDRNFTRTDPSEEKTSEMLTPKQQELSNSIAKALIATYLDELHSVFSKHENASLVSPNLLTQARQMLNAFYVHYLQHTDYSLKSQLVALNRACTLEMARIAMKNCGNAYEVISGILSTPQASHNVFPLSQTEHQWHDPDIFSLENAIVDKSRGKEKVDLKSTIVEVLIKPLLELEYEQQQLIIKKASPKTLIDLALFLSLSNIASYIETHPKYKATRIKLMRLLSDTLRDQHTMLVFNIQIFTEHVDLFVKTSQLTTLLNCIGKVDIQLLDWSNATNLKAEPFQWLRLLPKTWLIDLYEKLNTAKLTLATYLSNSKNHAHIVEKSRLDLVDKEVLEVVCQFLHGLGHDFIPLQNEILRD